MKLIFLDIDGVMNHRKFFERSRLHRSQEFCPVAVRNLREVIMRTRAYIVLSSTWRRGSSIKEIKALFSWYDLDKYVIGKTPVLDEQIRGNEIQLFMDEFKQPIERFVILDDDNDMGVLLPHLIHCKDYSGFITDERREQAVLLLGEVQIERK